MLAGSAQAQHVGQFVGEWRNEDSAARGTTRYVIDVSGDQFVIRGYGACIPTDCDWSAIAGGPRTTPQSDADDGRLRVTWNFGFKTEQDDLTLTPDGRLRADQFHDYAEGDPRPDRSTTEYFVRASAPRTFARVTVALTGRGAVSSEPSGLMCPAACSLEFEVGTTLTLRADPARKNRFRGWRGGCTGAGPTCTLTVQGETSVAASFAAIPDCEVPRLAGSTVRAAQGLLGRAHCRLGAVSRRYSRRIPEGRIIAQRPAPGTRLPNRSAVRVVVSRGRR